MAETQAEEEEKEEQGQSRGREGQLYMRALARGAFMTRCSTHSPQQRQRQRQGQRRRQSCN